MKNIGFVYFFVLSMLTMSACSPNYYIPNTQNVPAIGAKGETRINIAGNGNQLELQGAVGVSNQLAIQLNGGYVFPNNEDNGNGGSGKLLEAGIGYYNNLNERLLFDIYALGGIGRMENHFPGTVANNPGTTGKISASLTRWGLQPGLTFHTRYFSVSGSARVVGLHFSNIDGSLVFDNEDQAAYLKDHRSGFLFEPALTLRGGLEKIKLQLQVMKSLNLSDSQFRQDDSLLSLGLHFRL